MEGLWLQHKVLNQEIVRINFKRSVQATKSVLHLLLHQAPTALEFSLFWFVPVLWSSPLLSLDLQKANYYQRHTQQLSNCARLRRGSRAGLTHWTPSHSSDPVWISPGLQVLRELSQFIPSCAVHTAIAFPWTEAQRPQSPWHPSSLSYPSASSQNCLWGAITNSLPAEQHHKRCAVSDSQMAMLKTEGNMSGKVPEAYLNNRNNRDVRSR